MKFRVSGTNRFIGVLSLILFNLENRLVIIFVLFVLAINCRISVRSYPIGTLSY